MWLCLAGVAACGFWWRRPLAVAAACVGIVGAAGATRLPTACSAAAQAVLSQQPWTRYVTAAWGAEAGMAPEACAASCPQAAWHARPAMPAPAPFAAAASRGRALCAARKARRASRESPWLQPRAWWPPAAATALSLPSDVMLYVPAMGAAQECATGWPAVAAAGPALLGAPEATVTLSDASAGAIAPPRRLDALLVRGAATSKPVTCELVPGEADIVRCQINPSRAVSLQSICGPMLLRPAGDARDIAWHL